MEIPRSYLTEGVSMRSYQTDNREEQAIQRFVNHQVSSVYDMCGQSLKDAFGWSGTMDTAARATTSGYLEDRGYYKMGLGPSAPRGSIVAMPWMAKGKGHIGISLGDGTYISNYEGVIQSLPIPAKAQVWGRR